MKDAFITANMRFWLPGGGILPGAHRPKPGHAVPADFVGICVATSPDVSGDAKVLDALRRMGLNHVRLDVSYAGKEGPPARLLDALLDAGVHVLLHLVQPIEEARAMDGQEAQDRWRTFVGTVLDQYGARLDAVEIGSTVNRRKWCGYTLEGFVTAWEGAYQEARARGVHIAGPNVTDFEPVYNVAFLDMFKKHQCLPDIHTNNLFAERATEPELYDHKIAGHRAKQWLRYNTIKKARLLQRIASSYGVPVTYSTHVAWSRRRIDRFLPNVEDKQADYLARYLILMAASGALGRVYWGPMIGQREGVIDDGTQEYPDLFHVTLYERVPGEPSAWRDRVALDALAAFQARIPGATYRGRLVQGDGLEVHAFSREGTLVHAVWTVNGRGVAADKAYHPEDLAAAQCVTRDGQVMEAAPAFFGESPCYLSWPENGPRIVAPSACVESELCLALAQDRHYFPVSDAAWQGWVQADSTETRDALVAALHPDRLEQGERQDVLRDARNAVWTVPHPLDPDRKLVVKRQVLVKWYRKWLDRWKPAKARRSWNGAMELARRGIATPEPVAFWERRDQAVLGVNFYVCAYEPGDLSVRRFFTAYHDGATAHEGLAPDVFYDALILFLKNMHDRGIVFRDLSAGNVLVKLDEAGRPDFTLIDTARTRCYTRPATMSERLADLKRLCHPLHWEGRLTFVGRYLATMDAEFTSMRRLPFQLYDWKHRYKNWLKRRKR